MAANALDDNHLYVDCRHDDLEIVLLYPRLICFLDVGGRGKLHYSVFDQFAQVVLAGDG